ncbi:hypothetical protein HYX08_03555 [Candidatus Woesearchaeota archaeon]|nr:hypothetical protein [Candidatus Woesearchaeota archaeon]
MEICFKCQKTFGIFADRRYDTNSRLLCDNCWNNLSLKERTKATEKSDELRKQYKKKEKLRKIERAKERGFWKTSFDLTWGLFFFLIAFDFFRSIMDNTESTFQEMVNRAGPSAGSIFYLIMFFIGSLFLSVLSNILRFSWWKIKDKFKK